MGKNSTAFEKKTLSMIDVQLILFSFIQTLQKALHAFPLPKALRFSKEKTRNNKGQQPTNNTGKV